MRGTKIDNTKLRDLLYRKGFNQKEFAIFCKLSYTTIANICNGRVTTEETAQKIANALGVNLEEIKSKR